VSTRVYGDCKLWLRSGGRSKRDEWLGVPDEGRFAGTFVGCVKFELHELVGPKFVSNLTATS
jgi:hypothetical protein